MARASPQRLMGHLPKLRKNKYDQEKNNSRMEKSKLSLYYQLRRTKSINYPKTIIVADKKLIRNRNIICVMDKNNFKEA